ncbi:acetyl-CoA carboxylase biotin carboxyl carrier protein subunit [Chlamydia trachomatis]|nr:acetyl-CoA carboxylase biotin carboxyl carrier protein subunit [Chlamydia trachomatis]
MNISEVKDLLSQFDGSSLREFSYRNAEGELTFSKNAHGPALVPEKVVTPTPAQEVSVASAPVPPVAAAEENTPLAAEGELVDSPLVGVAYLSPSPDQAAFVSVGDTVKKGQTLLIIEAMKVMNEVPAPRDGIVTEIVVANEAVVEFGQGLVRIK